MSDDLRERVRAALAHKLGRSFGGMGAGLTSGMTDELTDAVLAAIPKPWQPLITAPRDGTPVDLWLVGSQSDIEFYCPLPVHRGDGVWAGRATAFQWIDGWRRVAGLTRLHAVTTAATHWMPLPDPPEDG